MTRFPNPLLVPICFCLGLALRTAGCVTETDEPLPEPSPLVSGRGSVVCKSTCPPESWPRGSVADCHRLGPGCELVEVEDGQPCWRGVGLCRGGVCESPSGPECAAYVPRDEPVCASDCSCDDGNECTADDCPEPGCAECHHSPLADGAPCMGGARTCVAGACCGPGAP